jgi:hypothetical protein
VDNTILIRTARPADHQPLARKETQARLAKVVRAVRAQILGDIDNLSALELNGKGSVKVVGQMTQGLFTGPDVPQVADGSAVKLNVDAAWIVRCGRATSDYWDWRRSEGADCCPPDRGAPAVEAQGVDVSEASDFRARLRWRWESAARPGWNFVLGRERCSVTRKNSWSPQNSEKHHHSVDGYQQLHDVRW